MLTNALVGYLAELGFGIDAGWGISVPIVAVGLLGPPLAALPAIRRATRLPLNEALQASGSAVGGQGRIDALLRGVRGIPRNAQIGLRGFGPPHAAQPGHRTARGGRRGAAAVDRRRPRDPAVDAHRRRGGPLVQRR